jgi:hypothetical protein
MTFESSEQARLNDEEPDGCQKSLALAKTLFPDEEWIAKEANIWVAKSRLIEEFREPDKWEREMSQVRILTGRGCIAYFLPESEKEGEPNKRYPDMVLDGTVLEIKSVSGTIKTLGLEFKRGYKQGQSLLETNLPANYPPQGHSVFIQLTSNMKVEAVKAKIAGELKNRMDEGSFICFFEQLGELYSWTYTELRAIIGKR